MPADAAPDSPTPPGLSPGGAGAFAGAAEMTPPPSSFAAPPPTSSEILDAALDTPGAAPPPQPPAARAPSPPPSPGSLIRFAHYEVLLRPDGAPWLLGQGGMGMTYKARDMRLQVEVALKIIHPACVARPEVQKLFIREARAAARVIHPNVASVLYLHDEPRRLFYAMEFVDGVSLHDWLRPGGKRRTVPPWQALAFAEQIARGLQAIHEQGVIHRDLKPANIMVVEFPPAHPRHRALAASGGHLLKIIDFGLARGTDAEAEAAVAVPSLGQTRGFRGTATYASPEQCAETGDLDARSDLYSLGCLLWEMLTGLPPFIARNQYELFRQHIQTEPPWAKLDAPEPVRQVLRALLAKKREDRPESAAAAAEDLQAAGRACPGAPAPSSRGSTQVPTAPTFAAITEALPASPRSLTFGRRGVLWAGAGALLGVAALAAGLGWLARPGSTPKKTLPAVPPNAEESARLAANRRVVAVLPFESIGGGQDGEDFADGIHEDILTALAKVKELRVIARSSVTRYRGRERDLRAIATELGAGLVIEGSVRRSGDRVRVTTQLIDAATGQNVWADSFTRSITDLFEIQTAVAAEITARLAVEFTAPERQAIARRPTTSAAAYETFVRARALERGQAATAERTRETLALWERCVALDPNFAAAHARLGSDHAKLHWYGIDRTPERAAKARAAAATALKLGPELAEVRIGQGEVLHMVDQDWEGAMREFRLALALEPGSILAIEPAAGTLRRMGRWDEALALLRRGAELAPRDAVSVMSYGKTLMLAGRTSEADVQARRFGEFADDPNALAYFAVNRLDLDDDLAACQRTLRAALPRMARVFRIDAIFWLGDWRALLRETESMPELTSHLNTTFPKTLYVGLAQEGLGNSAEARTAYTAANATMEEMLRAHPEDALLRMQRATALAGLWQRDEALAEGRRALQDLPATRDAFFNASLRHDFALILTRFGEVDAACELMESLIEKGGWYLNRGMLRHLPEYAALRGFPRFDRLAAKR